MEISIIMHIQTESDESLNYITNILYVHKMRQLAWDKPKNVEWQAAKL